MLNILRNMGPSKRLLAQELPLPRKAKAQFNTPAELGARICMFTFTSE